MEEEGLIVLIDMGTSITTSTAYCQRLVRARDHKVYTVGRLNRKNIKESPKI